VRFFIVTGFQRSSAFLASALELLCSALLARIQKRMTDFREHDRLVRDAEIKNKTKE